VRDIKLRKQIVERIVLGLVSVIFVATCLVLEAGVNAKEVW